ncbi:unnamed protein product [Lampetra fluviatilis]
MGATAAVELPSGEALSEGRVGQVAVDLPAMEEEIRAGTSTGPGVQDVAASVDPSVPEDADLRWRQMAAQLETLKIVLAQLCELVTPRTASGRPGGDPQASALPALSAPSATRHEDAILGVAGEERREAAILRSPRRGAAILDTLRCDAILNMPRDESLLRTAQQGVTVVI